MSGSDVPAVDPDRTVRDLDDRELIARHRDGDQDAFAELFRRHRDRMWAVAMRTCADRELAADCVQDAFISAFRRADSYRGEAAVTTWLHRIVVNACLDRLRRRKTVLRRAGDLGELDIADPSDRHGSTEVRLDVHEALAQLPEHQRKALVLVDMHAVPVAEAAQILGVAEGTVKSRCFRGREALAAILRPPAQRPDDAHPEAPDPHADARPDPRPGAEPVR